MAPDIDDIARVCHEANRAFSATRGDFAHEPWTNSEMWVKDSTRAGVSHALASPNTTAETLHENWAEHKLRNGWRYGSVKDPVERTHPCLVSWRDLPQHQRMKDRLFLAIVAALDPSQNGDS